MEDFKCGGGGHLNKAQLQRNRELSFGQESTDVTEFVQSKGGFSVIAETTCSELVSIRLSSHGLHDLLNIGLTCISNRDR